VIAREALVPDPRVLAADAPLREAAELLSRPHVGSVLVLDGARLVGCVTAETIVSALARGVDAGAATVADASDPDVTTIGPATDVDDAMRLMGERDLERVPVVEDGRLLGVLVREPLLRRLAEDEAPDEPEAQQQV